MSTKFITNQGERTLYDRFIALIRHTQNFDVLVAYFYLSGFSQLSQVLESTKKIRILVGLELDQKIHKINQELNFISSIDAVDRMSQLIEQDLENSADNYDTYSSINIFIDWLRSGKIQVRLYKKHKIHAKVYIMSYPESNHDKGRVITGSSNFTRAGLVDNIEYNVELRDDADYEFAKYEFDRLWEDSVTIEEQYIQTVTNNSWLNESVSPYHLYLKFLYEHFKDDLKLNSIDDHSTFKPTWHKDLIYQKQAVLSAKKILERYGGVFIADVVGLGKTIMAALLLQEYPSCKSLIISPPHLISAWEVVISDYRLWAKVVSVGKLDKLSSLVDLIQYNNIIIDEAHRFRNEATDTYLKLAPICRGKRVILLSATPYNNNPKDLLALIKLFQSSHDSNLPNLRNIEYFLNTCNKDIKELKQQLKENIIAEDIYYLKLNKIAISIRESLLRYVMIRRTRDEIIKYFKADMQNASFPKVHEPVGFYYQFNGQESIVFSNTLACIKQLSYARYKTIRYLKNKPTGDKLRIADNLAGFMKTLLIKRLESSKAAFVSTVNYFITSHEQTIKIYHERGEIYLSKKFGIDKIAELLDDITTHEDSEISKISQLIETDKIDKYTKEDIEPQFILDIEADLKLLHSIADEWNKVRRDIKLETFCIDLASLVAKHKKVIIFTEASDTAYFLAQQLQNTYQVLCVTGSNFNNLHSKILSNFSTNTPKEENEYNILITTDVLSEGISLQRVNVIVNYDIPWNPTRMMQRIGRINRVDSKFKELFIYNFFPTDESNNEINLTNNAKTKISMFIELLGTDSHTLTAEEVMGGKELFAIINGSDTETDSELGYLSEIKTIRDENPALFTQIEQLPKKCNSKRNNLATKPQLLTYFRQGQLEKYIRTDIHSSQELNFIEAAKLMQAKSDESAIGGKLDTNYFELLEQNKRYYTQLIEETSIEVRINNKNPVNKLIYLLKACIKDTKELTMVEEDYYLQFKKRLEAGDIPKELAKKINKQIELIIKTKYTVTSNEVMNIIIANVDKSLMRQHISKIDSFKSHKQEVILSAYFI